MKRDERKVGAGTWVLAGLWAALLVGAPLFLARARREVEGMGCFAVGRDAAIPFSATPRFGDREMALPWPTAVALGVPLALWLVLAAAVPALLVLKARRLPRRASDAVDVLAAAGLVAMHALLLAAHFMPLTVLIG